MRRFLSFYRARIHCAEELHNMLYNKSCNLFASGATMQIRTNLPVDGSAIVVRLLCFTRQCVEL